MGKLMPSLLTIGTLILLMIIPSPGVAACMSTQVDAGCCCPKDDCNGSSPKIVRELNCCGQEYSPGVPITSTSAPYQFRSCVFQLVNSGQIVLTTATTFSAIGPHDLAPPTVPLYTLHGAFLI